MTDEQLELLEQALFLNKRIAAELKGWEQLCIDYTKRKVALDNAHGRLMDMFATSNDLIRQLNDQLCGEGWKGPADDE